MLTGNQVPLDEHLFLQLREVLERFGKRVLHLRQLLDGRLDAIQGSDPLDLLRVPGERMPA